MQLTTASGLVVDNPTDDDIQQELRALPGGGDSFLILARDELTYLQVAGGGGGPLTLEYQDGSVERHYRAARDVSQDTAIRVFRAYREGGDRWRGLVEWETQDLSPRQNYRYRLWTALVILALAIVGLAVSYWWPPSS